MLQLRGSVFGYDGVPVTVPVSFGVSGGEVVAVVGPSGCGKSTILKTIHGLLPLVGGELSIDGLPRGADWLSRNVWRTLQSFPLLHWLTVEQNLRLAGRVRGIQQVDVAQVLSDFSALHLRERCPMTLSGGERCRASLAQAAVARPKVLLLDEPFAGLDLRVKADIAAHIFTFSRTHAVAVVFVTHDVLDAVDYADRIVVMARDDGPSRIADILPAKRPGALERVRDHLLGVDAGVRS